MNTLLESWRRQDYACQVRDWQGPETLEVGCAVLVAEHPGL